MNNKADLLSVVVYSADWWEHVCPRIRVLGPAAGSGIQIIKGNEWEQGINYIFPERVLHGDLVLIQRDFPRYSDEYEKIVSLAREQGKHIVYELDDLLTELPGEHPDRNYYLQARAAILRAVVEADAVIVSTEQIYDYIRSWNHHVWHFQNYLHDGVWSFKQQVTKNFGDEEFPIIIGYMGGHSHLQDLEMISPVLDRIIKRFSEKIAFRFIGVKPPTEIRSYENVEYIRPGFVDYVEFVPYFQELSLDIAIAPLQNNLFNLSKSHLKFLEYSALGIPGIYSNIPSYRRVIRPGENGFIAATLEEWEKYLTMLVEDRKMRIQIGMEAYRSVQDNWLLSQHAGEWGAIFSEIQKSSVKSNKSNIFPHVVDRMTSWYAELSNEVEKLLDVEISNKDQSQLIKELRTQLLENQQVIDTLNKQANDQTQTVDENQQLIKVLGEEKLVIEQTLGELGTKVQEQSKLIKQLEDQNQIQQQKKIALESQNDEKKQVIEQLEIQMQDQNNSIVQLQTQINEQGKSILQLNAKLHQQDTLINQIHNSKGWKVLQYVRRIRVVLVPVGSKRENILRTGYHALRVWRQEGFRVFVSKVKMNLFTLFSLEKRQEDSCALVALPGEICQSPAICVVLIQTNAEDSLDEKDIVKWIEAQTIQSLLELVVWNKVSGKAYRYGDDENPWYAPDSHTIFELIKSPYLCMASLDLLVHNETYLEYNLIALETEGLLFTVNLKGSYIWVMDRIQQGFLPGDGQIRLLRQVVQKEYLNHDFSINLNKWVRAHPQNCRVVGKIIKHTTEKSDTKDSLPFDNLLPSSNILIRDPYLTLTDSQDILKNQEKVTRIIHPVDTVIPSIIDQDDRPTVLIIQTYLAVGGAERVALNMMDCLKNEIRFVVLSGEYMDTALGTTADIHRSITPYVYTVPDYLNWNLNYSNLIYLIKRFQPVTLYIANGVGWVYDALTWIKKEYPDLRLVNQVYDYIEGWINRYDDHLVTYLDANIGVNRRIGKAFSNLGIPRDRIFVIPHRISVNDFNPEGYSPNQKDAIKEILKVPLGRKIITFISRIHSQKRPMDFLELARRFANDSSVYFLMVGDGPLTEKVSSEVERIKLENFKQIPFYKPSSDIFAVTDVMVLPSEYEGMPMVILEAQAMGVPVVVTDVGNNREVIELTKGGKVISNIGDITALYNNVIQLLKAPPDPFQVRKVIIDRFSMRTMGEEYRDALLGSKPDA